MVVIRVFRITLVGCGLAYQLRKLQVADDLSADQHQAATPPSKTFYKLADGITAAATPVSIHRNTKSFSAVQPSWLACNHASLK